MLCDGKKAVVQQAQIVLQPLTNNPECRVHLHSGLFTLCFPGRGLLLCAVSGVLYDDAGYMTDLFRKFEKNFYGIQKPTVGELEAGLIGGLGVWSLSSWSIIPIAIGGIATLVSGIVNRLEMKKAFATLSTDELHAYIAMKLTLIEEAREVMPEEEWKNLVDDMLKYVSNLRGDAEYNWLIEKVDGKRNKELIELCNLTIEQISKIIGI